MCGRQNKAKLTHTQTCKLNLWRSLFSINPLQRVSSVREYIKYPESKMYLIYGCDNPVTYEFYAETERSNEEVRITAIDREETLKINSRYFPSVYDWDYFVDDRNIEIEVDDFVIDEEDSEFEWTMLEMELAEEEADEEDEEKDYYFNNEEDEDYDEDLIGLNPEEMLNYIRNM